MQVKSESLMIADFHFKTSRKYRTSSDNRHRRLFDAELLRGRFY